MLVTTKGIVVHKTKFSDNSLIVNIFTEKFGLRSFMVKGAFSKKSKFRYALFSPLALLEITFDLRNSDLLFLKDIHTCYHYSRVPFDIVRNSILLFYNELIYKTVYQFHEDPLLFRYVEEQVKALDAEELSTGDVHIHFMVGLLRVLGVGVVNNYDNENRYFFMQDSQFQSCYFENEEYLTAEASAYFSQLLNHEMSDSCKFVVDKKIRMELLYFLVRYFRFHIPGFKMSDSLQILAEIIN